MKFSMFDFMEWVKDVLFEFKHVKKAEKSLDTDVYLVKDNDVITRYRGQLTEDRRMLTCFELQRVQIKPRIFDMGGKNAVFLPERSHGKIDIEKIKTVAESQKYEAYVAWKHKRNWVTTIVQSRGTMDWKLFNNDFSPDFSSDTFLISQSTALKTLKEMANWKLLLAVLAAFFIGGLFFSALELFIWLIYLGLT